MKQQLIYL